MVESAKNPHTTNNVSLNLPTIFLIQISKLHTIILKPLKPLSLYRLITAILIARVVYKVSSNLKTTNKLSPKNVIALKK